MIHRYFGKIFSITVNVFIALTLLVNGVSAAAPTFKPESTIKSLTPPASPTNLTLTEDADYKKIKLTWQSVPGILTYNIYRSTTQATYKQESPVASTNLTSWTDDFSDLGSDSGLHDYYYVITAVSDQGESDISNEVVGMPHYKMIWAGTVIGFSEFDIPTLNCEVQPLDDNMLPKTYSYRLGNPDHKICITGEVEIEGKTGEFGPEPDVWAQFGYGPVVSDTDTIVDLTQWTNWVDADYFDVGFWVTSHSRYITEFIPENTGNFYYTFRFSTNQGRDWVYPYYNPNGQKPNPKEYLVDVLQKITVFQDTDLTPPQAPTLVIPNESILQTSISLSWSPSPDLDIYAYDIFRTTVSAPLETDWVQLHRTHHAAGTSTYTFTDSDLVSNTQYTYRLTALDKNFNKAVSNQESATTLSSLIPLTLNFLIPSFTPEGKISINMAADSNTLGTEIWNSEDGPGFCDFVTLHQCRAQLTLQENYFFQFRFSRGSQNTIQTQADGNSPPIDPSFKVVSSMSQQDINRIVANWDDPLVTSYSPKGNRISPYSQIQITWNQSMPDNTTFMVLDLGSTGTASGSPVSGDLVSDTSYKIFTFSPAHNLTGNNHYQIKVMDQMDNNANPQISPFTWIISTDYYRSYLPFTAHP